jgi:hypothetical protein
MEKWASSQGHHFPHAAVAENPGFGLKPQRVHGHVSSDGDAGDIIMLAGLCRQSHLYLGSLFFLLSLQHCRHIRCSPAPAACAEGCPSFHPYRSFN